MTLRRLMKDYRPDYLGVVLDSKEMTFRQEQFADYKAHRPEMPEDLVAQLPYILRVCEALRVPVLRIPRYEADDIIGALARQATEAGLQTVVVTNDKDLCQLVRDDDSAHASRGQERREPAQRGRREGQIRRAT